MSNSVIMGVFNDEDKLLASIRNIREKGIKITDVISPFPIEEVFEELKLKTRIPALAFVYGVFGLIATFAFLYWTSVINYPLVFGGKPQNTLSFVIVIFVAVIFVTIFFTLITFFVLEKKGPGAKPKFEFPGITDDKFVIVITKTTDLDMVALNKMLTDDGAVEIAVQ